MAIYFTKYKNTKRYHIKMDNLMIPLKTLKFHTLRYDIDASERLSPFNAVFVSVGYNPSLSLTSFCYDKQSPFLILSLQLGNIF